MHFKSIVASAKKIAGENWMNFGNRYLATLVVLAIEVIMGRYRGLLTSDNVKSTRVSIIETVVLVFFRRWSSLISWALF